VAPATPIVALGEILWDLLPSGRRAGGAPFNFAFHCAQLGHPATIVSRVGDDDLGRELRAEIRRLGMSDEHIQTDPDHPTGTVRVALDATGQPKYVIAENAAWDFIDWNERIEQLAESALAFCFGTLAQRSDGSRRTIQRFTRRANPSCLVVCDLNIRRPFASDFVIEDSVTSADWLKVNEEEADAVIMAFRLSRTNTMATPAAYWQRMLLAAMRSDEGVFAVTRGKRGCVVGDRGSVAEIPGIPVSVVDTVGAGDAFTAALLTQSLEGKSLREAARFANAYAALVATKAGETPDVSRAEVERLL
jgi:fructokinase